MCVPKKLAPSQRLGEELGGGSTKSGTWSFLLPVKRSTVFSFFFRLSHFLPYSFITEITGMGSWWWDKRQRYQQTHLLTAPPFHLPWHLRRKPLYGVWEWKWKPRAAMWEAEKGGLFEPRFRRLRPTQLDLGNTTRCCLNIETTTTKRKQQRENRVWQYRPVISSLGKFRQENCEFKASLGSIMRPGVKEKGMCSGEKWPVHPVSATNISTLNWFEFYLFNLFFMCNLFFILFSYNIYRPKLLLAPLLTGRKDCFCRDGISAKKFW